MKYILLLICFAFGVEAHGQHIELIKGKDTVRIQNGAHNWIGLTTGADTILFNQGKNRNRLAYEISEIDSETITLKRPKVYRDTVFEYQSIYYLPFVAHDLRLKDHFRKGDKKFYRAMVISQYEYKTFAYKDITSIEYPPNTHLAPKGCIMCVFMLPLYPHLMRQANQRSAPDNYKIPEWQIRYCPKA